MLAALPVLAILYRFTEELSDSKGGLLLGAVSGLAAGYLISTSYPIALMLGGLIVGHLVANQFDTATHRLGLGIAIIAVLYLGNPIVPPLPVMAIALASLGDHLLRQAGETFSALADTNIVLNALLIAYFALGVLTLDSIAALVLAELAYVIGGIPFGSKKGKRHSAGS